MEKFTLNKNKPEVINCQLQVQGAPTDKTVVRLCLEFSNNKNLFFYGKINEDGVCEITIPTLRDIDQDNGILVIEAIAESTYFKVFEAEVELQSPVEVKLEATSISIGKNEQKKVKINKIKVEKSKNKTINEGKVQEAATKQKKETTGKEINPFIPIKQKEGILQENLVRGEPLTKFQDYLKNKK